MATEKTTAQRLFDVLEWLGLIVVPIGILTSGYKYVWHDLKTSPTPVRLTVLVLGLAVIALAAGIIVLMHAYRVERQAFRMQLGLKSIVERESAEGLLLPIYKRANNAYRWTGLSAINEVTRTDIQNQITDKLRTGTRFHFTLADPANTFAIVEQESWENADTRRITELTENINRSRQILGAYPTVSVYLSARIPVFRVTEVGEDEIHVAHYDRAGCGYDGTFLILANGDTDSNVNLFRWFKHYAAAERRNAVISEFQFTVCALLLKGHSVDDVVNELWQGQTYQGWRRTFDREFEWDLTEDHLRQAVAAVRDRVQG